MKDDPTGLLAPWHLLLLVLYTGIVFPVALLVVAAMFSRDGPAVPRAPCRKCGYGMVVGEHECPCCRAMRKAEN